MKDKEKRTEYFKIMMTRSELEELRKKAEEVKLDMSNYVRTKIFKK